MSETVDELTMDFTDEEGNQIIKQLDKVVLTKGTWSTVMYQYEELDKRTSLFKGPKFSIRRYQKTNGAYRQRSKFNISSNAQALQIIQTLQNWTKNLEISADADGDGEA